MRMPIQSPAVERNASTMKFIGGITPSFCSPCIFGHQVCCDISIFPPSVDCHTQTCDGGQFCTPCIKPLPFLPGFQICIPGGIRPC